MRSNVRQTFSAKVAVASLLAVLAAVGAQNGRAGEVDPAVRINRLYHVSDFAFAQKDLDGVFAMEKPSWTSTDANGVRTSLSDARAAMRYLWRDLPNERRVIWRALTDATSVSADGGSAVVRGTLHIERTSVDINGTVVDVHQVNTFVDHWQKEGVEWRLAGSRVLQSRRYGSGRPSAYLLQRIENLRQQGEMLRDFNAGINRSNCMYADQMQKFDYYEREQRCSGP